jgi:hypothetical protein
VLDSFLAGYELRRELRFGTSIISAIFPQIVGPERARVPKASRRRHLRSYGEPHRRHDDAWVSQRDWIVFWRFLKKYDAGRAWQSLRILDRVPDKGEVGGSSPPRPTINHQCLCGYSHFSHLPGLRLKNHLPKICQKSGRADPDTNSDFRNPHCQLHRQKGGDGAWGGIPSDSRLTPSQYEPTRPQGTARERTQTNWNSRRASLTCRGKVILAAGQGGGENRPQFPG